MAYGNFWQFEPGQQQGRVNQYGDDYQNQNARGNGMNPNIYSSMMANLTSPSQMVYGKTLTNMLGGLDTMNNLGASVGNAFDRANLMSSANMQAKYAPYYNYQGVHDTNQTNERMQQQRLGSQQNILGSLLPSIVAALGGIGGGQGIGGFQTNYGAGARLGSQAQPTNTQQFRNPLLAMLGG